MWGSHTFYHLGLLTFCVTGFLVALSWDLKNPPPRAVVFFSLPLLWPFNTIDHVVVTPPIKSLPSLLHNCQAAAVRNCMRTSVFSDCLRWLLGTGSETVTWLQRSHNPQVKTTSEIKTAPLKCQPLVPEQTSALRFCILCVIAALESLMLLMPPRISFQWRWMM